MGHALPWGRRYLAVRPDHFRVAYAINPFMRLGDQPDPARALDQWHAMVAALEAAGAGVEVLGQCPDAPDMVYAMNLGLVAHRPGADHVVVSHMRHAQRRLESPLAQGWFAARGFATTVLGQDGVGAHFEAGDAFAWRDALLVGYGPRTERLALKHLALALDARVYGVRLTHPSMYHLDLAFCPLDSERALVVPSAFDAASAAAVLALVPEPVLLSEEEALAFCANSVVVGSTVLMPACPAWLRSRLERWGFEVVVLDLSELHKGGGSVRCLTNPLDVRMGRDLAEVGGGEVRLA